MYFDVFVGGGELPVPLLLLYPSLTTSSLPLRLWWILGCFHSLAIVNHDAAMNTEMHVSIWVNVFVFLGHIPKNGIAGSYFISSFSFSRESHTASHSGYTDLHPHLSVQGSLSPHPRSFVICDLFYDRHSDSCAVLSHFVCVCFYFYWDIVALQCRLSVCYTAQWISCMHTCISSFLDFLPI